MEKFNNSSGDKEGYSCELRNFELKFFAEASPKRFANLASKSWISWSNKGIRHSETDQKTAIWTVSTFGG